MPSTGKFWSFVFLFLHFTKFSHLHQVHGPGAPGVAVSEDTQLFGQVADNSTDRGTTYVCAVGPHPGFGAAHQQKKVQPAAHTGHQISRHVVGCQRDAVTGETGFHQAFASLILAYWKLHLEVVEDIWHRFGRVVPEGGRGCL